jgi:hypothetical protein
VSDESNTPETEAAEEAAEKKAPAELTPQQKAKQAIRKEIRALRTEREEKRASWDAKKLNQTRRELHRLRRKLRKTAKAKA